MNQRSKRPISLGLTIKKGRCGHIWHGLAVCICLVLVIGCNSKKEPKWNGDAANGKILFNQHCASCHSLKMGGIGPKLGGITSVVEKDWLIEFIGNPEKLIKANDTRAKQTFDIYKSYMPSFSFLSQEEIESILTFIHQESDSLGLVLEENVADNSKKQGATERPEADLTTIPEVEQAKISIVLEDFIRMPKTGEEPPSRLTSMRSITLENGKNSLFVHDQRGIIYQLRNGKADIFLDLKQKITDFINAPGLGTGLGSFAFHPEYAKNGKLYTTHTEKPHGIVPDFSFKDSIEVAMQWVLTEWENSDPTQSVFNGNRRELLRIDVPSGIHGMQDMKFSNISNKNDPDYGMLYLCIGDGGSTISGHPELCHTLNSPLGTILRIDPLGQNGRNGKYGIPKDNPFIASTDKYVWQEIYAYGFRNPHQISWFMDGKNAKLIAADVGEVTIEELNIVNPGNDYGWNLREGYFGINPQNMKDIYSLAKNDPTYGLPLAFYGHETGNAICGGYVYNGSMEELNGQYIFGDIVQGKVFSLDVFSGKPSPASIKELGIYYKGEHTDMKNIVGNSRVDLRFGKDGMGNLYVMDKADGTIRKITGTVHE